MSLSTTVLVTSILVAISVWSLVFWLWNKFDKKDKAEKLNHITSAINSVLISFVAICAAGIWEAHEAEVKSKETDRQEKLDETKLAHERTEAVRSLVPMLLDTDEKTKEIAVLLLNEIDPDPEKPLIKGVIRVLNTKGTRSAARQIANREPKAREALKKELNKKENEVPIEKTAPKETNKSKTKSNLRDSIRKELWTDANLRKELKEILKKDEAFRKQLKIELEKDLEVRKQAIDKKVKEYNKLLGHIRRKNWSLAKNEVRNYIEQYPDASLPYKLMIGILLSNNETDEADNWLAKARVKSAFVKEPDLFLLSGYKSFVQSDYNEAIDESRKAVGSNPYADMIIAFSINKMDSKYSNGVSAAKRCINSVKKKEGKAYGAANWIYGELVRRNKTNYPTVDHKRYFEIAKVNGFSYGPGKKPPLPGPFDGLIKLPKI